MPSKPLRSTRKRLPGQPTLTRDRVLSEALVLLVETAEVLPASIFRPMELTLTALQRAGIGPEDALRAYFLLTNFTIGQVSYQIRGPFRGVDPTEAIRQGRLPAVTFPA